MSFAKKSVDALIITNELIELIAKLEPMVYGQINRDIADSDKCMWVQAGALVAFTNIRYAIECMKTMAAEAYTERVRPEDIN